jgi:hypothetical protein
MSKYYVFLMLLAFCASAGAATMYVDDSATGANNGTSWANAYTSLQTALGAANASDTLLVAAGMYKPDASDRTVSFNITDAGLSIQGGYEPKNVVSGEVPRNPAVYQTILSGDLNGNDIALPPLGVGSNYFLLAEECWPGQHWPGNSPPHPGGSDSHTENTEHVVRVNAANVTLDGLTIKGGNTYASAETYGGGMIVSAAGLTMLNCTITENFARNGGGMWINAIGGGSVTLTNVTISQNTCSWEGGGLMCDGGATLVVDGCIISNNTVESCEGNEAGGIKFGTASGTMTASFSDCLFTMNASPECLVAAGLELRGGSNSLVELHNCVFIENWTNDGNTIWLWGDSGPTSAILRAYNTLVVKNMANNKNTYGACGVGVWGGTFEATNCTIAGNTHLGKQAGGVGIYKPNNAVINLKNTIVWGNSGCEMRVWPGNHSGTITASYCDIEYDPNNAFVNGGGNIASNPMFVAGDPMFNLQSGSPCIDAGDPASTVGSEPKCNGGRINIGAQGGTINANPTVNGAGMAAADLNCDGNVDLADFSALAGQWLQ